MASLWTFSWSSVTLIFFMTCKSWGRSALHSDSNSGSAQLSFRGRIDPDKCKDRPFCDITSNSTDTYIRNLLKMSNSKNIFSTDVPITLQRIMPGRLPDVLSERPILVGPDKKGSLTQDRQRIHKDTSRDHLMSRRAENGTLKILNGPYTINGKDSYSGGEQLVSSNSIAFPYTGSMFEPQIPDRCKHMQFCDTVLNYPEEYINKVLATADPDLIRLYFVEKPEAPQITQRAGPNSDMDLCNSYEKTYYHQAAQDGQLTWQTIVNHGGFRQAFVAEICEPGPCSEIVVFGPGTEARCRQKYSFQPVVTINGNGTLLTTPLTLPSCCSCVIHGSI